MSDICGATCRKNFAEITLYSPFYKACRYICVSELIGQLTDMGLQCMSCILTFLLRCVGRDGQLFNLGLGGDL